MSDQPSMFHVMANAQHAAMSNVLNGYPLRRILDTAVRAGRRAASLAHPNPLLRHGEKYFSQNDEDGILLEICRRLDLPAGRFLELGVGQGLESNSLILLMSGWRGAWMGDEDLAFTIPDACSRLVYQKARITRENVPYLYLETKRRLGVDAFDMLCIDLDGNDYHILEALLGEGLRPAVIIVEYNGKFPPPVRFRIDYDPGHVFGENDYYGASLQSFVDCLTPVGYQLVACNITGLNAFFVDRRFSGRFQDVPLAVEDLFIPADYAHVTMVGHPPSPRTVLSFLKD